MGVIFPILFYFLNTTVFPQVSESLSVRDSARTIYLVKISWHTGIIFNTQQVDTLVWKYIKNFNEFRYVDVGWGDEAFYQHTGFDLDLAVRALFEETASTLRIAGFNRDIESYLASTDYAERLLLSKAKFDSLCTYIQSYYSLKNSEPIILSRHLMGSVIFYKSKGWYSVFNTCNTWIARGLKKAGCRINDEVILSEQLFRETLKFGKLVKAPE